MRGRNRLWCQSCCIHQGPAAPVKAHADMAIPFNRLKPGEFDFVSCTHRHSLTGKLYVVRKLLLESCELRKLYKRYVVVHGGSSKGEARSIRGSCRLLLLRNLNLSGPAFDLDRKASKKSRILITACPESGLPTDAPIVRIRT